MKIMKYGFIAVLIIAVVLLFLNGSIPKKYLKAVDGQEYTGSDTMRVIDMHGDWKSFVRDAEEAIGANEKMIAAFRETIEEAGPKAIQEFRLSVDILDRKNGELKNILHAFTDQRAPEQALFRNTFILKLEGVGRRMHLVMKGNG